MCADEGGLFQLARVERGVAAGALLEDAFGLDPALLGRDGLDPLVLFTKPRHAF